MTITPNEPMRIVSLRTSNFMNIELIEITPEYNTIVISGPNGAGKSSLINSIAAALSGKVLSSIPEPVRKGEKSGDIVLDLGDIVIKRHFTNSTSSLVVENAGGMVYKSPQALLDGFRGKTSFDPMQYASLSEKQQKDVLLELIDLPINLDDLDKQRKEIYDNRTQVNRDINKLSGQMEGIEDRLDVSDEELSAADVMDEMKAATDKIAVNNNIRAGLNNLIIKRKSIKEKQDRINDEILKLQDEAEQIKLDLSTCVQSIATDKDIVEELIDPDLDEFKCKMDDVETINQHVREKQERMRILSEINDLKAKSLGMTIDMTEIDELKDKTIMEANMPVPGLGFDENGVTFDGIPLSQRSDGERRKISARIGMALNPNLRVLWLKDASLLDQASMKEMEALADEHGYQIWLERVDDIENVAIHIEEGRVVE